MNMQKKRVCVIGAGAAGLCAAKHLSSNDLYDFVVFEKATSVGGTWTYTEDTGVDQYNLPIHSSMYDKLKTNIPKEIMGFADFPFPQSGHSFAHRTQVLSYLEDYCKHFQLYQYIKFAHHVANVRPEFQEGENRIWKVDVKDLSNNTTQTHEFDAIIVCNGHYSVPYMPDIENMEEYQGKVLHSHCYRKPCEFRDKDVVVLGAASSGMDIALEVAALAKTVYLCHNLKQNLVSELPGNVQQRPGIKTATKGGFILRDDTHIEADSLVLCTGYYFNFSFLTESCEVKVDDNRVTPLYKHLIHQKFNELCFIGLPLTVIPFPMFDFQIKYFLQVLQKQIILPSIEDMAEEEKRDYENRLTNLNLQHKYAHKMGSMQWDYFKELCPDGKTLPAVIRKIYEKCEYRRRDFVMTYKVEEYKILNDDDYVHAFPNDEEDSVEHGCCGAGFEC